METTHKYLALALLFLAVVVGPMVAQNDAPRPPAATLARPATASKAPGADGFIQRWLLLEPIRTNGLTLVSAGMGLAFCTSGMQKQWTGIELRPLSNPVFNMEQSVAYRRDASSPALETFLGVMRRVVRKHRSRQGTL